MASGSAASSASWARRQAWQGPVVMFSRPLHRRRRAESGRPAGTRLVPARRRQGITQIGLMKPDQAQAGRDGVIAEPSQRQLVRDGDNHQCVRRGVPVTDHIGIGDGEVQRRMCRLTCLRPRCQIGTGDQVQAGETATLAVRHEPDYACLEPKTPRPSSTSMTALSTGLHSQQRHVGAHQVTGGRGRCEPPGPCANSTLSFAGHVRAVFRPAYRSGRWPAKGRRCRERNCNQKRIKMHEPAVNPLLRRGGGAPGARTQNPRIKSPLLYH
jgi:hypothetical protein